MQGTATSRPLPVRSALLILWLALAIGVAASLVYYSSSGVRLEFGDVGSHLLGYALVAMLLLGIGAANAWARILFVVFLGWKLALAVVNLLLESGQLPWFYALDVLILALQAGASLLLFRPSSNEWFRRRATP
jgi:hypothetical protein